MGADGLLYRRARLGPIAKELRPLFVLHWKELALNQDKIPLDVDWDRYLELDLVGRLQVLTVRDGDSLVGYVFNLISPALHYRSTMWCHIDMYWLAPAYRFGWNGVRMFTENEKFVKRTGAKIISVAEKLHFKNEFGRQVSVLFKRMGYSPIERIYTKYIGD